MAGKEKENVKSELVEELELDKLVSYPNNPFKEYIGKQFDELVESINANGLHQPIIVRQISKDKYEILSGHNRVRAMRQLNHKMIRAIVHYSLDDLAASFIVTETNLIQRTFANLTHSERAAVLHNYYVTIKQRQGYRSDLADLVPGSSYSNFPKKSSLVKLAEKYELGKDTSMSYLRIYGLNEGLQKKLDEDKIGFVVADRLSFLNKDVQKWINDSLVDGKEISVKQVKELLKLSKTRELTQEDIKAIFVSEPKTDEPKKIKPVQLSSEDLSKFFTVEQTSEDMKSEIIKALEEYKTKHKK
jgi:ParB family chromosome partitioning protein